MTKPFIYAIGDIHGQLDLFEKLLENYDSKQHQLVLIGDLNDRGKESKKCLLLGKKLVEETGAIYLLGNHEAMFLQFLKQPEDWFESYARGGGRETLESFLHPGALEEYSASEMALMIMTRYRELIDFLFARPLYYEWGPYIFVHAGVDLTKEQWKDTHPQDFLWIREDFHKGANRTGKTIVFGHTITAMLYEDVHATALWQSDHKIGIDGGGIFGGSVHGVIFDQQGIVQDYEEQNTAGPWESWY